MYCFYFSVHIDELVQLTSSLFVRNVKLHSVFITFLWLKKSLQESLTRWLCSHLDFVGPPTAANNLRLSGLILWFPPSWWQNQPFRGFFLVKGSMEATLAWDFLHVRNYLYSTCTSGKFDSLSGASQGKNHFFFLCSDSHLETSPTATF